MPPKRGGNAANAAAAPKSGGNAANAAAAPKKTKEDATPKETKEDATPKERKDGNSAGVRKSSRLKGDAPEESTLEELIRKGVDPKLAKLFGGRSNKRIQKKVQEYDQKVQQDVQQDVTVVQPQVVQQDVQEDVQEDVQQDVQQDVQEDVQPQVVQPQVVQPQVVQQDVHKDVQEDVQQDVQQDVPVVQPQVVQQDVPIVQSQIVHHRDVQQGIQVVQPQHIQVVQPQHLQVVRNTHPQTPATEAVNQLLGLQSGASVEGMVSEVVRHVMKYREVPDDLLTLVHNCQQNKFEAKRESEEKKAEHLATQREVFVARATMREFQKSIRKVRAIQEAFGMQCDDNEPEEEDDEEDNEPEEEDDEEDNEEDKQSDEESDKESDEESDEERVEERLQHLEIIKDHYMQKIASCREVLKQCRIERSEAQEDKVVAAHDHNQRTKAAAFTRTTALLAKQLNGLLGLNKPKRKTLEDVGRMENEARYFVKGLTGTFRHCAYLKVSCMTDNGCKGIPEAQAICDKIILIAGSTSTGCNVMKVPRFTQHMEEICKANNNGAPTADQMDAPQFARLLSFVDKVCGVLGSVYDVPGGNITGTIKDYCNFLTDPEPPSSSSAPAVVRKFTKPIFPGKTTILPARFKAALFEAAQLKVNALSDHLREAWKEDKGADMLLLLLPFLPDFMESLVQEDGDAKSLDAHFKELAPAIITYQHTIENSFNSKHPGEYCKVGQRCKGGAEKVQLHFAWQCCRILMDCLSAPSSMYGMKRQPAALIDNSRVLDAIGQIESDDEETGKQLADIHKDLGKASQRAADEFDRQQGEKRKREVARRKARAAMKRRMDNDGNLIEYMDLDGSESGKDSGDGDR